MRNLVLIFALFVSFMGEAQQTPAPTETAKAIAYLLNYVAKSDAVFIRNGKEYKGSEAAAHLKDKYDHFKSDIKTPEDFIRLAATKSMVSGKPYFVRLKDGTQLQCSVWLTSALKDYRDKQKQR